MQINLLSLLGLAPPTAGTDSAGPVPGEFATFLQATQMTGVPPPPGVPAPPDLSSLVSAIGNEEVSPIQPNAGADQLDFLPKKATESSEVGSVDSLLASQSAWMVSPNPIVVASMALTPQRSQALTLGDQSATLLPATNPGPVFTAALDHRGLPGLSVMKSGQSQTSLTKPIEFADHVFSSINTTPLPFEISTVELPSRPVVSTAQSGFQVADAASVRPTVSIEGLIRQNQSGQQFDSKTLEVLRPISFSGKTLWTLPTPPVTDADRFILDRTNGGHHHENLTSGILAPQSNAPIAAPKIDIAQVQLSTPTAISVDQAVGAATGTVNSPIAQQVQAVASPTVAPIGTGKPIAKAIKPLTVETDESPAQMDTQSVDKTVQTKKPLNSAVAVSEPVDVEVEEVEPIAKRAEANLDEEIAQPVSTNNPKLVDRSIEPTRLEPKPALDEKAQREVMRQTIDRIDRMAIHRPMSQMVIRLSPENLGEITLTVRTMGMRSEADISATNEKVVHALEANRAQLTHTIEAKGVNLGSLSLQFGGGKSDQAPANQQDFTRQLNLTHALAGESSAISVETTLNETGSGSLNLVI